MVYFTNLHFHSHLTIISNLRSVLTLSTISLHFYFTIQQTSLDMEKSRIQRLATRRRLIFPKLFSPPSPIVIPPENWEKELPSPIFRFINMQTTAVDEVKNCRLTNSPPYYIVTFAVEHGSIRHEYLQINNEGQLIDYLTGKRIHIV